MRFAFPGLFLVLTTLALGEGPQWVEGFDQVVFHYNADNHRAFRDFRGTAPGYMTAGWWSPGQVKDNTLSWQTAVVPAKEATTFVFVGASSILPSQFSRGPSVRLSVNGHYALTFNLGVTRDFTWKEEGFELHYLSKRVEYPYTGTHRQTDLTGNSGLYRLTVPATAVEAGQPVVLKIDLLPFAVWDNGWFMVKERRDALKQSMESLAGEIETLRQDLATVSEQTQILATKAYPELLDSGRFVHEVIYTDGFRHLHPADLVQLRNGEILITAREATEHYARDGDVIMLRSSDGGKTWGGKQIIGGIADLDEREGCGLQLRDGTVIMGIYFNGLYNPDGSYNNQMKRLPGKRYLGAYFISSKDNGHTWSEPAYVETAGMPFTQIEGPTDAPIEMPDGSVVVGVIGYQLDGDSKNNGSVLLRSTDQGKTWRYLSTIGGDPGGKFGGLVEPGLVRTKTGRLVAALRTPSGDGAIYTTLSDDDGRTWVPVRKTAMHGHPTDLIQLADGRVMATYGVRPPIHDKPGGIRACFSRDNGETWDLQSEVQLRNDFLNWDVGYPESLQLADGRVLTVYYYNLFGRYFLGGTFWTP